MEKVIKGNNKYQRYEKRKNKKKIKSNKIKIRLELNQLNKETTEVSDIMLDIEVLKILDDEKKAK